MSAAEKADDPRMVVQLSVADLRSLVRDEVQRGMQQQVQQLEQVPGKWVDVSTAAKYFGRTSQTIRNWIKDGAPAKQIGTSARPQFRIHLEQFEAWMAALHQQRGKEG